MYDIHIYKKKNLEPDTDVDDYNDYIFDTRKFHDDL